MDLSKFSFNKKILSKVVALNYNQFCNKTLSNIFFLYYVHCLEIVFLLFN